MMSLITLARLRRAASALALLALSSGLLAQADDGETAGPAVGDAPIVQPGRPRLQTLTAAGGTASIYEEQGQLQRGSQNVTALGAGLFGDKVNLYSGALEFTQTDVSLPGNSALAVALSRRHTPGRHTAVKGHFGDWDLDVPHMRGVFPVPEGWIDRNSGQARCSNFSAPPMVMKGSREWPAMEYWQGNHIHIPGIGAEEVLVRSAANTRQPNDGNSYPLVTQSQWQIRCLPTLAHGTGEGFVAVSPEGTQYRFDWMTSRQIRPLGGVGAQLGRAEVFLMATEVRDRFDNTVSYSYDATDPWRLTGIQSSDGRQLTISYTTVNRGPRIASVRGIRGLSCWRSADSTSTLCRGSGTDGRAHMEV